MMLSATDDGQSPGLAGSYLGGDPGEDAIDADCGRFFRSLRRHLDLSRQELAARLGCQVSVIAALERGDAGDLPPWPETVRIVTAFTAFLGLDPRPALRLVGRHWGGGASAAAAPMAAGPAFPSIDTPDRASRRRRSLDLRSSAAKMLGPMASKIASVTIAWPRPGIIIAVVLSLTVSAFAAGPKMLGSWASNMPEPFAGIIREARDFALTQFAPTKNGMRVIEVADPRSRRGDKLRPARRSW